ncbi:hypothetical protein LROSL1_0141 [Furfurilactobacillus rossiae]|uniref:hypothetical protein n=1 Tax=Furfurilactobacillus rossiae TaxID=231049 RepID=UPI0015BC9D80|nr:hypothetical protein [Furfurilactobacillus rossiae]MCF6165984.1 hypothetical protein [Furfurilactobacillus rossiae]QLE62961.1 hypothetical protein LROSL1_0141 [Furfurilactobacillus rossiae]
MKNHGKLNATLLTPAYWEKYHLSDGVDFANQFQAIDAQDLGENDRKQALDELLKKMAAQGYNNPANSMYVLYSAILVQRN